jgi:hypothetical protein
LQRGRAWHAPRRAQPQPRCGRGRSEAPGRRSWMQCSVQGGALRDGASRRCAAAAARCLGLLAPTRHAPAPDGVTARPPGQPRRRPPARGCARLPEKERRSLAPRQKAGARFQTASPARWRTTPTRTTALGCRTWRARRSPDAPTTRRGHAAQNGFGRAGSSERPRRARFSAPARCSRPQVVNSCVHALIRARIVSLRPRRARALSRRRNQQLRGARVELLAAQRAHAAQVRIQPHLPRLCLRAQ